MINTIWLFYFLFFECFEKVKKTSYSGCELAVDGWVGESLLDARRLFPTVPRIA